MIKEDFRRVEAWLYLIPRVEIALETLTLDLEKLDTKAASPPTWMSQPSSGMPSGTGSTCSRQERWVEFLDEYPVKRNEILEGIRERRQQLTCFEKVMAMLQAENSQLAQLVRHKYISKVQPDKTIYEDVLFVGHSKFYDMRRFVVQAFLDCLPGQFPKIRRKCG